MTVTQQQQQQQQEKWLVCPGDVLGSTNDFLSGEGTYVDEQEIRSLLLGVCVKQNTDDTDIIEQQKQQTQQQQQQYEQEQQQLQKKQKLVVNRIGQPPVIPKLGDVVTGKVVRVTPKVVQVQILCVEETALKNQFEGIIRLQDIRITEIDKIDMQNCFWPGDIVRSRILSLGDARSYFLTTAEDALGVVSALSDENVQLVPKNQIEMECPKTNQVFKRKVAIQQ